MTPQKFKDIFVNFKTTDYEGVLPDFIFSEINGWMSGSTPIPAEAADRLTYLSTVHDVLKMEAIEEAYDARDKVAYWPLYLRPSDFKAIDPKRYDVFLGCRRVYNKAIYNAVEAFLWAELNEGYKPCSVWAYTLCRDTYFPWLEKHGYKNTEACRKEFAQESYLRNRPVRSDMLQLKSQGQSVLPVDAEAHQKVERLKVTLRRIDQYFAEEYVHTSTSAHAYHSNFGRSF